MLLEERMASLETGGTGSSVATLLEERTTSLDTGGSGTTVAVLLEESEASLDAGGSGISFATLLEEKAASLEAGDGSGTSVPTGLDSLSEQAQKAIRKIGRRIFVFIQRNVALFFTT